MVRKWREMLLQLVRRTAGGDEMDLIEIEAAVRGARDGKMAVMNGIERAAENGDAPGMLFGGGAVGLSGRQWGSGEDSVWILSDEAASKSSVE